MPTIICLEERRAYAKMKRHTVVIRYVIKEYKERKIELMFFFILQEEAK
jgi:hypothetical protein